MTAAASKYTATLPSPPRKPRGQMPAHFQHEPRSGQSQSNPEPLLYVGEFRIGHRIGTDRHRFQCHAADRTTAWTDLADLGMHRAGEGHAECRRFSFLGREVLLWVSRKFRAAAGAAEMERGVAVREAVPRCRWIKCHSAN